VPYLAVIGRAEAVGGEVALRLRDGRRLPSFPVAQALASIDRQVKAYSVALWDAQQAAS
jgi:threonyl-tRNA synthetase